MKKKYLLSTFIRMTAIVVMIFTTINYTFAANGPARFGHLSPDAVKSHLSKIITGKVTDEDGLPLPGVTVRIKGSSTAVGTDNTGAFSIEVPNEQSVLVFSFVGYVSKDVAVSGKSVINVALKSDSKSLNEVVVVGYGTQKRANVTGAVSSVSGKTLSDIINSIEEVKKRIENGCSMGFDSNDDSEFSFSSDGDFEEIEND